MYQEKFTLTEDLPDDIGLAPYKFNELLQPAKRITHEQFTHLLITDSYGLQGKAYDQVKLPDDEGPESTWRVHYFFMHSYVIAAAHRYSKPLASAQQFELDSHERYRYNYRFFLIGCEHDMKELASEEREPLGFGPAVMFDHAYRCTKCGYIIQQFSD